MSRLAMIPALRASDRSLLWAKTAFAFVPLGIPVVLLWKVYGSVISTMGCLLPSRPDPPTKWPGWPYGGWSEWKTASAAIKNFWTPNADPDKKDIILVNTPIPSLPRSIFHIRLSSRPLGIRPRVVKCQVNVKAKKNAHMSLSYEKSLMYHVCCQDFFQN